MVVTYAYAIQAMRHRNVQNRRRREKANDCNMCDCAMRVGYPPTLALPLSLATSIDNTYTKLFL